MRGNVTYYYVIIGISFQLDRNMWNYKINHIMFRGRFQLVDCYRNLACNLITEISIWEINYD